MESAWKEINSISNEADNFEWMWALINMLFIFQYVHQNMNNLWK